MVKKAKKARVLEDHADKMAFLKTQHAVDSQLLGAVFHDEAIGIEHDDSSCDIDHEEPQAESEHYGRAPRSSEMRGLKVRESKR